MRILLVEPDAVTAQAVELMLKSEGFNVYTTDDGDEAVELGKMYDYDILVLADVVGAHRVVQQLRTAKCKTPILRVSGLAGIEDIVLALDAGTDDYMTKPFHKDELVARIHAVTRRSKGHAQSVIHVGTLKVNLSTKTVSVGSSPVHLTGKEYAMLELMVLRKGSLITKEMFLNHLYGGMDEPEIKIIDVFICKLRKKLTAAGEEGLVQTVWGRGYVLQAEEEVAESPSLAPELQSRAEDTGVDFVPQPDRPLRSPSLVPIAGQK